MLKNKLKGLMIIDDVVNDHKVDKRIDQKNTRRQILIFLINN